MVFRTIVCPDLGSLETAIDKRTILGPKNDLLKEKTDTEEEIKLNIVKWQGMPES